MAGQACCGPAGQILRGSAGLEVSAAALSRVSAGMARRQPAKISDMAPAELAPNPLYKHQHLQPDQGRPANEHTLEPQHSVPETPASPEAMLPAHATFKKLIK